jgi:hypothetical protein
MAEGAIARWACQAGTEQPHTTATFQSTAFLLNLFNARPHQFKLLTRYRAIVAYNANDALNGEALETIDALDHDGPSLHSVLLHGPSTWPHAPAF